MLRMALKFVSALRVFTDLPAVRFAVDRPFADAAAFSVIALEATGAAECVMRVVG